MNKKLSLLERFRSASSKKRIISAAAALTVVVIGVLFVATHASDFFAASEPENGSVSGNASIVSDASASGGKAIKFDAPAAPPPGGGGGGGGGGTQPPSNSTCPLPKYPDSTCAGVPAGTTLTTHTGDLVVTADNAVVDGLYVRGCIDVRGVGVTVKNSKAECITTSQSARARNPANPRLTIQDSDVDCGGQGGSSGIGDQNINAYRVNIHDCENGFDADSDMTIMDSYIHNLFQSTEAHTDGLQSPGGSNLIIKHNTFYADAFGACGVQSGHTDNCGGTSAININNNASGPHSSNSTITENLLAGGAFTLYCPIPSTTNFVVTNNHFSKMFYPNYGAFGRSSDCSNEGTISGNVDHDTGQALSLN